MCIDGLPILLTDNVLVTLLLLGCKYFVKRIFDRKKRSVYFMN